MTGTPISLSPALLVCGAFVLCAPSALGQDAPGRSIEEEIEEAERLTPRIPNEIEAFPPREEIGTSPVRAGLTSGEDWMPALGPDWPGAVEPPLLPERSFVNRLPGTVIRGPEGTLIFIPRRGGEGPPARPLLLLPNAELERFARYVFGDEERVDVLLTGQAFIYDGRNHVLPIGFRKASEPMRAEPAAVIDEPAAGAPVEIADDPDVAALMAELEERPLLARPTPQAQGEAVDGAMNQPATTSSMDGGYLAGQRGRVVRTPRGTWVFMVDNDDTSSGARGGVAYTLLPCLMLQSIEALAMVGGEEMGGVMSGRVYGYEGGAYLLPTLFQREHRGGVDPLQ